MIRNQQVTRSSRVAGSNFPAIPCTFRLARTIARAQLRANLRANRRAPLSNSPALPALFATPARLSKRTFLSSSARQGACATPS